MNYNKTFWFYSKDTKEGAIYDGRIKRKMPHGYAVKTVWQGECTEPQLMKRINNYEKKRLFKDSTLN